VEGRPIDDLHLKGFNHPILAAEILRWRDDSEVAAAKPAPTETAAASATARRKK